MAEALGNLTRRTKIKCGLCSFEPPPRDVMGAVTLHWADKHFDAGQIKLEQVVTCTCGALMEYNVSRPTGGGHKDYHKCPSCGNIGFIKRDS